MIGGEFLWMSTWLALDSSWAEEKKGSSSLMANRILYLRVQDFEKK